MTTKTKETRQVSISLPERYWEEIESLSVDLTGKKDFEKMIPMLIMRGLGVSEWSNTAALGYAIMAATDLGMNRVQINDLTTAMYRRFDRNTQEEAKKAYYDW